MKEKVKYIDLPDGAKFRRVEVTEDGRIAIFYTLERPKPNPLIGGTEVYQKDNNTLYWYCKIKNERDEFMYVDFNDLTEKDLYFETNGKKREIATELEKDFEEKVLKALKNKPKEGYRWIPVFEPSKNSRGNLQYVAGEEVFIGTSPLEWEEMFKEYSPKNGSQMASTTTYFLLLLRWLKDGIATLEEISDDARWLGNFKNNKYATNSFEKTGEREFGGLFGFVGNTSKTVRDSEKRVGFSSIGGYCQYPYNSPTMSSFNLKYLWSAKDKSFSDVGLLELTK